EGNNRIKQMPQQLSAIDNAGSNFCVLSAKASAGHLLYSMDVICNKNPMLYKLLIIAFTFTLVGCSQNNRIAVSEIGYRYDKEVERDSLDLEVITDKHKKEYIYRFAGDSAHYSHFHLTVLTNSDSVILFYADTARLVDQKSIDGKLIKKYYYNREDMADEELHLFIAEDIGLIGYVEEAWDGYSIFNHPNTDIEEKLRQEKTGFFYKR
ncbi:hypothetical protein, partial [Cesiribacter sp. SM1]|uniref:hypothetical protein n=1 Tax=Cesiribacter sp. SM1 TaxID=2861196 RepID=UPI001CD4573F